MCDKIQRAIKYLEVIIDDRLNFKEHVKYIDEKARSIQKEDNFGGSNIDNDVCLPNMVGGTIRGNDKENTVLGVPSKCNQTICGFRAVSDKATLVLAKTIPIDVLADEMRTIYLRRLEYPGQITTIKEEERRTSMRKWQS